MNADGRGQRRVIRNGVAPRWSPDGRLIAFTRSTSTNRALGLFQRDVWVANADGSDQRNVSPDQLADDWLVGWSPGQR